ncbi:HET-domain-containing protein [Cadophora sp. DSE1049]|nr:HET-domain-containing protein [Cadophora sp. DSE1049]
MSFAKAQLQTCIKKHNACKPRHLAREVPSRVLEIKGSVAAPVVRLIETRGITGANWTQYAILSYCWGGPQSVTLRDDTHRSLLQGIDLTQLGKTIQDAIKVCNAVGIQYLWVDALCIKQDSPSDKDHEISRMGSYFKHSLVTICAASARRSTDGFLHSEERDAYSYGPLSVQFQEQPLKPPGRLFRVFGDRSYEHPFAPYNRRLYSEKVYKEHTQGGTSVVQLFKLKEKLPREPISERAWTFQEVFLSPRLLIFTSRQLYWCCCKLYIACGGPHSRGMGALEELVPNCPQDEGGCVCGVSVQRRLQAPESAHGIFNLSQRDSSSTDELWEICVSNFSGRALTFESDKLAAFSAAVSHFHHLFGSRWPDVQYIAGLWYTKKSPRSFLRQLLWSSDSPTTARRPEKFRAPTWSWAAIDGQVAHFDRFTEYTVYPNATLTVDLVMSFPVSTSVPFGAIKWARLRVRGKIQRAPSDVAKGIRHAFEGQASQTDWNISLDTVADERFSVDDTRLFLLEVIPHTAFAPSPIGLVLYIIDKSKDAIQGYRRLGLFCYSEKTSVARALFNTCPERQIDII